MLILCVIGGGGETAGSVVEAVADSNSRLYVVCPHGFVYSRGESYLENTVFTNPVNWKRLRIEDRLEFIKRSDRGVFSQAVQARLSRAASLITIVPGRGMVQGLGPSGKALAVQVDYLSGSSPMEFDFVVDARGGDPWWFADLLDQEAQTRLARNFELDEFNARSLGNLEPEVLDSFFDFHLRLRHFIPYLFAPMLAGLQQGPGFPNLSCLGSLSDRVLKAFD